MAFKRVAVVLSLGCVLFVINEPSSVAGTKKKATNSDPALPTVEKVLRAEVAGEVDRKAQLAGALKERPDSAAVRWQAGFVRDANSWKSYDEFQPGGPEPANLTKYESLRRDAQQTFAGQLELANWCGKQGLVDQERAHLFAALAVSHGRQEPAVLERLGYVHFGTQWLSREQMQDWQRLNRQAEASLKKWEARLELIVQRLGTSPGHRKAALRDLQKINDSLAVPAIEYVLAGRDEELAQIAVQTFHQIDGVEATLALAKQGIFSLWPGVRASAATVLKKRKLDDFVPSLLRLLSTPGQTGVRIYEDPSRGCLSCSYTIAVETDDAVQFHVSTLNIVTPLVVSVTDGHKNQATNDMIDRLNHQALQTRQRANGDAIQLARDQIHSQNNASEVVNDRIRELNRRVIAVLAEISGREASEDPRMWWQWWQAESDSYLYGKEVVVTYDETETLTAPVFNIQRVDCLAAGALVRTDRGLKGIEEIRVGDRVLAQDVETGELAYKPVLHTTVRPPKELWTVRLNGETLMTTGGHRFWNSGIGWVKSRDLESQALLHTVAGNTPVWTAKKGEAAQTFNLLVADFHTFFVGRMGLLSQDVQTPRGTDNLVPGLSRANAKAEKTKK